MIEKYKDRHEAGIILAKQLSDYFNKPDVILLALPRGGVPVAYPISLHLHVPLEVFIVRKLGVPEHPELAMGAIASGGTIIFNKEIIQELNILPATIDKVIEAEKKELTRRESLYRSNRSSFSFKDKTIILVDDGIATGATMHVAIKALRKQNPLKIIVAVPVMTSILYKVMLKLADEVICPLKPAQDFYAVGIWYENFTQVEDQEVSELLAKTDHMLFKC